VLGQLGLSHLEAQGQGSAWRGGGTRGGNGVRALLHGCHGDKTTNTWRASLCPTWGPFLGHLCSELGYGP